MNKIVLIGFMGTGKTAVGKILAHRLGYRFLDLDTLIEEKEKKSIPDIFGQLGEDYFRKIESQVIEEVSGLENLVVATGGGAVMNPQNRTLLRKGGWIVCLSATPETIQERTGRRKNRPLLQKDHSLEIIRSLIQKRSDAYSMADFTIDTSGISAGKVAQTILQEYEKKRYSSK